MVVVLPYSSIFCQLLFFLFFNLLLSFWLCKEAQCVYLRLHLGWKSLFFFFLTSFSSAALPIMYDLSQGISLICIVKTVFFYLRWENFSFSLTNLNSKLIYFYMLLPYCSKDTVNQYCLAIKMLRSNLHHFRVGRVYSYQSI